MADNPHPMSPTQVRPQPASNPFAGGSGGGGGGGFGDALKGVGMGLLTMTGIGGPMMAFMEHSRRQDARTEGMTAFQEALSRSGDPRAALIEVMRNPQYGQWVGQNPGFQQSLIDAAQAGAEGVPDDYTLSPGQQRFSGSSNQQVAGVAPELPAAIQEFLFANGDNPEKARKMAYEFNRAKINQMSQQEGGTATERAAQRLFQAGTIDATERDLMIGGDLDIVTVKNQDRFGKTVGPDEIHLVSKALGQSFKIGQASGVAANQDPLEAPSEQPGQPLPGANDKYGNAVMFLGGGFVSRLLSAGGSIARQGDQTIDAGLADRAYRNQIAQVRGDLRLMTDDGRLNVNEFKRLDNLWVNEGNIEDPRAANVTGKQFRLMIEDKMREAEKTYKNARSEDAADAAYARFNGFERILRQLPTVAQMDALEADLASGALDISPGAAASKVRDEAAAAAQHAGESQAFRYAQKALASGPGAGGLTPEDIARITDPHERNMIAEMIEKKIQQEAAGGQSSGTP